jgi:hypothetical protein
MGGRANAISGVVAGGHAALETNYASAKFRMDLQRQQQEAQIAAQAAAARSGGGGGSGSGGLTPSQQLALDKFNYDIFKDERDQFRLDNPMGADYLSQNGDYDTAMFNPRNQYDQIALAAIRSGNPHQYLTTYLTSEVDDGKGGVRESLDRQGYAQIMAIVGRSAESQQQKAAGGRGSVSYQQSVPIAQRALSKLSFKGVARKTTKKKK